MTPNLSEKLKKFIESLSDDELHELGLSRTTTAPSSTETSELNIKISNILQKLGMPTTIKGYNYSLYAISKLLEDPSYYNLHNTLYPAAAKKFDVKPATVNRAIRTAIETAWKRVKTDYRDIFFDSAIYPKKMPPANKEFLTLIADHIRLGKI